MVLGRINSPEQEAAKKEARDQRKAEAGCATGPAKIFNDVACAIGTLSDDVENYWRYSGPGNFFAKMRLAQMNGKFKKFRKETETSLHFDDIDAGLMRLRDLAKGLPPDDRRACEETITETQHLVRAEQATHARDRAIEVFKPSEQKEITKFLSTYPSKSANCSMRLGYHEDLEYRRASFERKALEKMTTQKIEVFRKPLSFKLRH